LSVEKKKKGKEAPVLTTRPVPMLTNLIHRRWQRSSQMGGKTERDRIVRKEKKACFAINFLRFFFCLRALRRKRQGKGERGKKRKKKKWATMCTEKEKKDHVVPLAQGVKTCLEKENRKKKKKKSMRLGGKERGDQSIGLPLFSFRRGKGKGKGDARG